MTRRLEELYGAPLRALWAGTFHHVANLALRRYGKEGGLSSDFAILDREDARDLLAAAQSKLGQPGSPKRLPRPAMFQQIISMAANHQCSILEAIGRYAPRFLDRSEQIGSIARQYSEMKLKLNLVDYDDLLIRFRDLLDSAGSLPQQIAERFQHILVDEYQDTNALQGTLVDRCASIHRNLMVVGDDAQSIYSFRGADFRNIIEFPERYTDARVYKLETNYRSTPEILALANSVIALNKRQFAKVLRPTRSPGQRPALLPLIDVYQQASFVAQRILELHQDQQTSLGEMAVLYRAHAHSLELQVELTRRDIPYSVRSGLRFFEQAHIKDALAYLRVMSNSKDRLAWQRLLKLWPGVGQRTVTRVCEGLGDGEGCSAAGVVAPFVEGRLPDVTKRSLNDLAKLLHQLESIPSLKDAFLHLIDHHYRDYAEEAFPNASVRIEDLLQLADYTGTYDSRDTFLADVALVAGFAGASPTPGEVPDERITLSTVHQAKGLEWRVVFLLSLTEGQFPQPMALQDDADLEEERRLFYVACTRAKDHLYLCQPRFHDSGKGPRRVLRRSRFLSEIGTKGAAYEEWEITEAEPVLA